MGGIHRGVIIQVLVVLLSIERNMYSVDSSRQRGALNGGLSQQPCTVTCPISWQDEITSIPIRTHNADSGPQLSLQVIQELDFALKLCSRSNPASAGEEVSICTPTAVAMNRHLPSPLWQSLGCLLGPR